MTERVADFHRLTSRLRLTGALVTRTALRIGSSGGGLDGVDLPVIKDATGRPFIPGASLKGALRSTIEALVRGIDRHPEVWACDPLADRRPRGDKESRDSAAPRAHPAPHDASCGHHEHGQRSTVDTELHCAVCRLFGSHVVASHVRFCDALLRLPKGGGAHKMPVEIRDGVAIDRDLRRVLGPRKYDFEVVSPGAVFAVELFVENPRPWLMGLLAMGFDQLAEGFTALGGFTSRGLGRVTFTWSSIHSVTAGALLRNEPPTDVIGDAVTAQLHAWRGALADKCKEVG